MQNFESQFIPNSKPKSKTDSELRSKQKPESNGVSRRGFLKGVLLGGAASAIGLGIRNNKEILNYLSGLAKDDDAKTKEEEKEIPIDSMRKENEEEDAKSIREIIKFNNPKRIEFDLKTAEALKNHWKERHKKDPSLKDSLRTSLENAYFEMGEWEPYLKREFSKVGVPEKYIYLAIAESYWKIESKSDKGAIGPYQFMHKTGNDYELASGENFEERCDPIKSAGACARLLKDLHDKGGDDWDLALSGYNGGFYWKYLKEAKQNNQKINYTGFLNYLENQINEIRDCKKSEIKEWEMKYLATHRWVYTVKKGDTLRSIAIKTRLEIDKLCQLNKITPKQTLSIGQEIKIPINKKQALTEAQIYKEQKEEEFYHEIAGFSENLNYPPKFNAIIELIQEKFVTRKKPSLEFKTIVTAPQEADRLYVFKKEDVNLHRMLKKFPHITLDDISRANPTLDPRKIRVNDQIIIPRQKATVTLETIAEKHGLDLDRLVSLNPSILKPNQNIPPNFEIRI